MADVFISYHVKSAAGIVRQIGAELRRRGISCWYSEAGVSGGEDFMAKVSQEIDTCQVFLLILDEGANTSFHVRSEVHLAIQRKSRGEKIDIIPFYLLEGPLSDPLRYALIQFQRIDGRTPPLEDRIQELATEIEGKIEHKREEKRKKEEEEEQRKQEEAERKARAEAERKARAEIERKKRKEAEQKKEAERREREAVRKRREAEEYRKRAERKAQEERAKIAIHERRLKQIMLAILIIGIYRGPVQDFQSWSSSRYEYQRAETLLESGDPISAAMAFGAAGKYRNAHERSLSLWDAIIGRNVIAAGSEYTIGLRTDGSVVSSDPDEPKWRRIMTEWEDIVSVAAGHQHVVGLHSDGSVVIMRSNGDWVRVWEDIVAVTAGKDYTIGLRTDGTVVSTGSNTHGQRNVSTWKGIIAIAAGDSHTVGLKSDGTVVAVGNDEYGQRSGVSEWQGIVAIAAGNAHTIGLCSDGSVVSAGADTYGQRSNLSEWQDIVMVAASTGYTVGLRSDGIVLAAGANGHGQRDVSDWTDIVEIAAGTDHTAGLRSDGIVFVTGNMDQDVSSWTDIRVPDMDRLKARLLEHKTTEEIGNPSASRTRPWIGPRSPTPPRPAPWGPGPPKRRRTAPPDPGRPLDFFTQMWYG